MDIFLKCGFVLFLSLPVTCFSQVKTVPSIQIAHNDSLIRTIDFDRGTRNKGTMLDGIKNFTNTPQVIEGDYVVFITDATFSNGCHDGKIDLVFTGGHPPFDVEWTGPNDFAHAIFDVSGNYGEEDISNLEPGSYRLFTADALCGTREDVYKINCVNNSTVLKNPLRNAFGSKVFPTHFSDYMKVEIDTYKPNDLIEIFVTNVIGNVVFSKQYTLTNEHEVLNLSFDELKGEGVFFVIIKNSSGAINNHRVIRTDSH